MNKTRTLCFISGPGAATWTWRCDQDYNFVGVHSGTGIQQTVAVGGQGNPTLTLKQSFVNSEILFATTTTTASNMPTQKTFLPKDTILTISQSAGSACCTIVLEYVTP